MRRPGTRPGETQRRIRQDHVRRGRRSVESIVAGRAEPADPPGPFSESEKAGVDRLGRRSLGPRPASGEWPPPSVRHSRPSDHPAAHRSRSPPRAAPSTIPNDCFRDGESVCTIAVVGSARPSSSSRVEGKRQQRCALQSLHFRRARPIAAGLDQQCPGRHRRRRTPVPAPPRPVRVWRFHPRHHEARPGRWPKSILTTRARPAGSQIINHVTRTFQNYAKTVSGCSRPRRLAAHPGRVTRWKLLLGDAWHPKSG